VAIKVGTSRVKDLHVKLVRYIADGDDVSGSKHDAERRGCPTVQYLLNDGRGSTNAVSIE
jgi:hypothetical protein